MTSGERRPGPVEEETRPLDHAEPSPSRNPSAQSRPGAVDEAALSLPDLDDPLAGPDPPAGECGATPWRAAWRWVIAALVTGLIWHLGSVLLHLWQTAPVSAALWSLVGGATLVAVGRAIALEYRAAHQLDNLASWQSQLEEAVERGDRTRLVALLERVLGQLRRRRPELVKEFEMACRDGEAQDIQRLFEHLVLQALDEEADRIILQEATTAGLAVTAVPHPALDVGVILWRSMVLVRRIAACYGLVATALSSVRLLKHALSTAIAAAGLDLAAGLVLGERGSRALKIIGKRAATGGITYLRLYHLGRLIQRICRPLPMSARAQG